MHKFTLVVTVLLLAFAVPVTAEDSRMIASESGHIMVHPIEHASVVLEAGELRIAFDPVDSDGPSEALAGVDLALVTDIHGDHFDAGTLRALMDKGAAIVAPAAVAERMDESLRAATTVLANGEKTEARGVMIHAVPMYNITEGRLKFHVKGRGNGYVLELNGLRIYVGGDTEGVPEMRALENIDVAFVPMNLPYTMDVTQAADAVIEMHPRIVYPYHYHGQDGLSDVARFAELVHAAAPAIEVRQLDWYPED